MAAVQQRIITQAPSQPYRPFTPQAPTASAAPVNRGVPVIRQVKPAVAPALVSQARASLPVPVAARVAPSPTCGHIGQALSASSAFLDRFKLAIRWGGKREARLVKGDGEHRITSSTCTVCTRLPSRVALCLECGDVLCYHGQHARQHLDKNRHRFYLDCRTGSIFCLACNDYVQHPATNTAARIVADLVEPAPLAGMKRKRVDYKQVRPNAEGQMLIAQGAKARKCDVIRGIRNLGATCFLNVVLQALLHNPLVRGYFLADRHNHRLCPNADKHDGSACMSCEVDRVFSEFFVSGAAAIPYGPISFLSASWQVGKDLAGYSQQDAHEFLISTLDAMHNSTPGHRQNGHCDCVVHSTFAGELRSDVRCGRCGNVTTALDPTLDLSLDIRSPRTLAAGAEEASTLFACLDRYTSCERLGSKQYTCTKCGTASSDSTKQLSINKLPPILCIQLKRFEHANGSRKIDTRVRFPLQVDMSPYTSPAVSRSNQQPPLSEASYDLFAVVTHEGKLDTGHYYIHVRRGDTWTLVNDDAVSPASAKDVLQTNPYLLFYARSSLSYAQRLSS